VKQSPVLVFCLLNHDHTTLSVTVQRMTTTFLFLFFAFLGRRIQRNIVSKEAVDRAIASFAPATRQQGDVYGGSLLGVECVCTLHRGGEYANLELSGVPFGGRLEGTAWLRHGNDVELDPALGRAVSRRLVRIEFAKYRAKDDTVFLIIKLPVFGSTELILHRVGTSHCKESEVAACRK
jgi:hypothetical protein